MLAHMGNADEIKLPIEILEEITDGGPDEDPLQEWLRDEANRLAILLDDEVDQHLVQRVLTDFEIEQIGRDPFLIAYALANPAERSVVTTEVSAPRKTRQNRKIPDVCDTLGIAWCDTFTMLRELRFSTAWRKG